MDKTETGGSILSDDDIKMLLDECGVTLDSSGVKFLKQIAEVFVRNAVDSSYEIAKLHKGEKIDAKDLALHLKLAYGNEFDDITENVIKHRPPPPSQQPQLPQQSQVPIQPQIQQSQQPPQPQQQPQPLQQLPPQQQPQPLQPLPLQQQQQQQQQPPLPPPPPPPQQQQQQQQPPLQRNVMQMQGQMQPQMQQGAGYPMMTQPPMAPMAPMAPMNQGNSMGLMPPMNPMNPMNSMNSMASMNQHPQPQYPYQNQFLYNSQFRRN